jgi:D-alanyl-D-alanine carboxypeptidase (penicillin-binding protein 5/6)
MFLAPGQIVSLRELILGLAIPSGNDAAVAVALRFGPTVQDFVNRMNLEAQKLGLKTTHFVEPSGISEDNMTSALEFAGFCREYITTHPESLQEFHSVREFAYPKPSNLRVSSSSRPSAIVQYNHNSLLYNLEGVDGLKTGYIDEAGYNIALTAARLETRFIAVILGAPAAYGGERLRDADGRKLLTWGFNHFKTLKPQAPNIPPARIWKGAVNWVELTPGEPLALTTLINRGENLSWEITLEEPLIAPLPAGSAAGTLVLYDKTGELQRTPLITTAEVEPGNFFKRTWDGLRLFFKKLFNR